MSDDACREKVSPVAAAVRAALASAGGDVRGASLALERAARQNRELRDSLMEPHLATACWNAVSVEHRKARRRIWGPATIVTLAPRGTASPTQDAIQNRLRVVRLGESNLLLFPLPGGQRLGDARREDVIQALDEYQTKADDMSWKARWLRLIAQSVPDGARVCDVLDNARLDDLKREARHAV